MSDPMLAKDWKRAIWRAPLHMLLSAPVAVASVVIPPIGQKYVAWRADAEHADELFGRDTPQKAAIDFYSQTVLVRGALRVWKIKP